MTPTPAPLTVSSVVSETIGTALAKNQTLKSYRGDILFTSEQNILVQWKGEVRAPDAHYVYSDGNVKNAEMIQAGGKAYLKNTTGTGAPEWFVVPEAQMAQFLGYSPRASLQELAGDLSYYQKSETSALDGLQCDVYVQDKRAVASTFIGMLGQRVPPSDQAAALFDKAELKVWICPDGYMRQLQMTLQLTPQGTQTAGVGVDFLTHMYDLDQDITIEAPTNVGPLPLPSPTSTPGGTTSTPTSTPPPATPSPTPTPG